MQRLCGLMPLSDPEKEGPPYRPKKGGERGGKLLQGGGRGESQKGKISPSFYERNGPSPSPARGEREKKTKPPKKKKKRRDHVHVFRSSFI